MRSRIHLPQRRRASDQPRRPRSHRQPGRTSGLDRDGVLWITADDVNGYLHEVGGAWITARDFRSWGATAEVAAVLGPSSRPEDEREAAKAVIDAVDHAAARLGNTRAVCRDSYIHPALPEAFLSGELANAWRHSRRTTLLTRSERTVLAVLNA